MRLQVVSVALLMIGTAACAAIGGLGSYSEGSGDQQVALSQNATDGGLSTVGDESTAAPDEGAPGDDAGQPDGGLSEPTDGNADRDARPVCSSASCGNGCCDTQGNCVGGQSRATCGGGGAACKACSSGLVCKGGACAEPVVDSGPALICPNGCKQCGAAQSSCCKASDNTCGCAYPFAPCL